MAIDTAEKRKSLVGLSYHYYSPGVTPNATPDAEWRHQSGHGYSGILAGLAAPAFDGPIPDIELTVGSDATQYDLSAYFTNATSYSIAPAVEAGWTFNAGVLTVDPTEIGSFGPYTVTGTNVGGSTDSNAFAVSVVSRSSGGEDPDRFTFRTTTNLDDDEAIAMVIKEFMRVH